VANQWLAKTGISSFGALCANEINFGEDQENLMALAKSGAWQMFIAGVGNGERANLAHAFFAPRRQR